MSPPPALKTRSLSFGSTIRFAKKNGRHTIIWLRSRSSKVLPPSSDTNSALREHSTTAYTRLWSDGAIATATRPHGLAGRPFAVDASSEDHVAPASFETKSPLPLAAAGESPPERK